MGVRTVPAVIGALYPAGCGADGRTQPKGIPRPSRGRLGHTGGPSGLKSHFCSPRVFAHTHAQGRRHHPDRFLDQP